MSHDPWGPQDARPPQQYAPYQPAPTRQRHTGRRIVLLSIAGVVGALVFASAIASVAKGGNSTSATTTIITSTTGPAAVGNTAAVPASSAAATRIVLEQSGDGTVDSKSFTVGANWSLAYSFNCSSFGQQGNFQVFEDYPNGDILVNALALKGAQTTYEHADPGTHSFKVNSECSWRIKVTDGDDG